MEYRIRPYARADKHAVLALRAWLGESDEVANRRYFEWKYQQNPFLSGPVFSLACLGDEVVGMRGLYATPWSNTETGGFFVLPHADDLVVHPHHRGRGLFLPIMEGLLGQAAEAGFAHVLSLSGGPSTQELSLATGWSSLGDVERVVRAGADRSLLGRIGRRLTRLVGGSEDETPPLPDDAEIDAVVSRITSAGHAISASGGAVLDDLETLAEVPRSHVVRAMRTGAYVRWRLSNPSRRYRTLHWKRDGAPGVMILSWNGPDARSISVVELSASDDRAFRGLLEALCSDARLEIRALVTGMTAARRAVLAELGFVPFADALDSEPRRRFLIAATGAGGGSLPPGAQTDGSLWRYGLLETMQV